MEQAMGPIRAEIANVLQAVQLGANDKEKLENLSKSLGMMETSTSSQQQSSELHLHPMMSDDNVDSNYLSRQV